ncbi:EAL domain-containing protein [Lelliottia amnigena]|nr:EAL domain-containing protein [Lelliottia amnigena]CAI9402101.1 putative cyclic di-GMP phosphodiesterase PdeG [Lelliottia sp. T2.26D-8]MBL5921414.1 EAL domain-containing protein [Lelliottia amnigena]PEG65188.1 EAL domain-containing protein [Lelliottia amnigena]QXA20457.1 EAL domain-containing protein [Lelliottia amnigena]
MENILNKHHSVPAGRGSILTRTVSWLKKSGSNSPLKTLQNAIDQRQITPFYQPFINGITGEIAGVEVLARWKHPSYGYVSPDVFIPLAEKHNLIIPLTHSLIQQVIADLQHQIHRFPVGTYICINISAQNCLDPSFEVDTCELLQKFTANQSHVVMEITERDPLHFTPELSDWFAALRRSDISVALDDFGTGYSNLSYISALNPEFIKIDKMFVSQIGVSDDTRLVDSLIDLAKNMRLKIIAEGVETQVQADYLRAKKIDFMQGFYFCKPLPVQELMRVVMAQALPPH